ncbi:MAG: XRE family transcriptional regulator [Rickettsiales bacterium]|jgi:transcriptional regulator with XRE-family HTH domain|nr:XRE family transcriptional regulator [Rickettsiales bacterium]
MAWEEICFPNNLRNLRLSRGIKMTEVAKKTGVSLSAMSKVEKGVRRLKQNQILKVCDILQCKLSDIFIKDTDDKAEEWNAEIRRRLTENEGSGLKIFGAGIHALRRAIKKTIANAAHDANMTLSVYHKIETGQREIFENELEPLARALGHSVESMFQTIADLYNAGKLDKQIDRSVSRVRNALRADIVEKGADIAGKLYGADVYAAVRKNMVPVYGHTSGKHINFIKSDEKMLQIKNPKESGDVYAVPAPVGRLGQFMPKNAYLFADASQIPVAGDLAVLLDADYATIKPDSLNKAQVVMLDTDQNGNLVGRMADPDETITIKNPRGKLHKIIQIVID